MNGQDMAAAFAVIVAIAVGIWGWWRGRQAENELHRLLVEHRIWGAPGVWVCDCGGQQLDRWSRVPDGRGMIHGTRHCQPDLSLMRGDIRDD